MVNPTTIRILYIPVYLLLFVSAASAQITVYNNFGPGQGGWDYNYSTGWTVAGINVPTQYGVEQAMGFQSTADGVVTDIWVAFFYVPSSTLPDEVTIRLARNTQGLPPDSGDVMEEWIITEFESWYQWNPPHHLQGNGTSYLQEGENYWLWAIGGETTWCGWCLNIDPGLTCPHTLRREGENWLPIADETASAFRVDVIQTLLSVSLTPATVPIQIPPSGGSFDFNVVLENSDPGPVTFDAWIMVQLPDLSWYGPVLGPVNLTLPGMTTIDRDRTQNVPAGALSGIYTYEGRVGIYPDDVWHSNSFTFEKLETGDGVPVTGWMNTGEYFLNDEVTSALLPSSFCLFTCHPNPFNPMTTISYAIPDAAHVTLNVYDVSGRLVTSLIDGYRQAGYHQLTFDASNLTSGIYLMRMEAGSWVHVQKMVLVK